MLPPISRYDLSSNSVNNLRNIDRYSMQHAATTARMSRIWAYLESFYNFPAVGRAPGHPGGDACRCRGGGGSESRQQNSHSDGAAATTPSDRRGGGARCCARVGRTARLGDVQRRLLAGCSGESGVDRARRNPARHAGGRPGPADTRSSGRVSPSVSWSRTSCLSCCRCARWPRGTRTSLP